MDKLYSHELANGSATVALLLTAALSIVLLTICVLTDPEAGVNYEVPTPDQCNETWKWEEIQTTSLKVAYPLVK